MDINIFLWLVLLCILVCVGGGFIFLKFRDLKKQVLELTKSSSLAYLSYLPLNNPTPILCSDPNGKIVFANKASEYVLSAWNLKKEEHLPMSIVEPVQRVFIQKKAENIVLKIGGIIYKITLVPDPALKTVGLYIQDITRQKKIEETLVKNELYDSITHLPNRNLFEDYLKLELIYQKKGSKVFVLVIKLIDYVNIKTHHDAAFCEKLLNFTQLQLKRFLSDDAVLSRLGEKEFAIMESIYAEPAQAVQLCQKIIHYFDKPIQIKGVEVISRVVIGVAYFPEDGSSAQTLLKHATVAQQKALTEPSRFAGHTVQMQSLLESKKGLLIDLYKAIEKKQFEVVYQPQVLLSNGERVGAEALIRWHHPELGLVSPLSFVPLAESSGLIIPLGQWIIERVFSDLAAWKKRDPDRWMHCKIAINLSAVQFRHESLLSDIQAELLNANLSSENIEFEMTESILAHNMEEIIKKMHQLTQSGFSLSMDDFGTGYSSLSYLKKLPIHKLKIDKAFIDDIEDHEPSLAMVKSIIELGHNLGLKVLAEGVETQGQIDILKKLNCDIIQGYYFSKPISAQDFEHF